ncbi:hypothetical protein V6N13_050617 [Hibiscus sabdariffa]
MIMAVAAVTLTEALLSGSSPQFSQKSYNKFECRKPTPVQSYDRLGARNMSLDLIEEVQARWWIWKVLLPVKFIKKGKNYGKKVKVDEIMNNLSNDGGEAYATQKREHLPRCSADISPFVYSNVANINSRIWYVSIASLHSSAKFNVNRITRETDEKSSASEAASVGKYSAQSSVQSRQWKPFRVQEDSPTDNDLKISEIDSAVSTLQVPAEPELVSLPNKYQSRRKMNLKRGLLSTDTPRYTLENQPNKQSLSQDRLKEKLSSCHLIWLEDCALLNGFTVLLVALGKLVSIPTVKKFAETNFTMQLVITAPSANLGGFLNSFCLKRGKNLNCIGSLETTLYSTLHWYHGNELLEDIDCMPLNPLENFPETLRRQNLDVDDFSMIPVSRSYIDGAQKLEWRRTRKKEMEEVVSKVLSLSRSILQWRDEIESYDPPKERVIMSEADDNDNGCAPAVRLTGALQRRSCSQFSQKPYNKVECRKSTPVQSYDRMV